MPSTPSKRTSLRVEFQPGVDDSTPFPHEVTSRLGQRARTILLGAAIVAISVLSMAPALRGKFIHVDPEFVTQNVFLRSLAGVSAIWTSPQRLPEFSPVSFTLLAGEYRVFRDRPAGYHLVSLLLHAACALILWSLLGRLALPGAWFAGALFAAHPVHVDAVAWVSQQKTLLCAALYLSAAVVYFRFAGLNLRPDDDDRSGLTPWRLPANRWLVYALSLVLFGLAALAHATAATFAVVMLIAVWWARARLSRRDVLPLVPMMVIGAAVFAMTAYVEFVRLGARGAGFPAGAIERVQLVGSTIGFYALTLLAPTRLSFAYPSWQLGAGRAVQYVPVLLLVAGLSVLWMKRKRFGRSPVAVMLAYIAVLLPVSGVVNFSSMRQGWTADHLQYLASAVPIAAFAAWVAGRLDLARLTPAGAGLARGGAAVLVGGMMAISFIRSRAYYEPAVLWARVLEQNPRSMQAHNTLGRVALDERNDPRGAYDHFRAAIHIDPGDVKSRLNLADALQAQKDWDKAIAEYYQVLTRYPQDVDARFGLAGALRGSGNSSGAVQEYLAVLSARPDDTNAMLNLAGVYDERGQTEDALATLRRALEQNPRFAPARVNLAVILFQHGDLTTAAEELSTVLTLDPQNFEAAFNAGACLGQLAVAVPKAEDRARLNRLAEGALRRAVQLRPTSPEALNNLGIVLARQARGEPRDRALACLNEAVACFRRAATLGGGEDSARSAALADAADQERRQLEAASGPR